MQKLSTNLMIAGILAVVASSTSCGRESAKYKTACEQGIYQLHDKFNSGRYEAIYAEVDDEFRKAMPERDFVAFMRQVHQKLGSIQDSQLSSISVNWSVERGESIMVFHATKFTNGLAREQSFWKLRENRAFLVGYFVDSDLLKGSQISAPK